MSPSVSRTASRTAATIAPSTRWSLRRGSQRASTGNMRPALVTIGAPPSSRAIGSPSSVADMTRMRRSSRTSCCECLTSASPRSACSERSWNSSKITSPTPSSVGSLLSMRVRTPSVTTSIWVFAPTRVSRRTR